MRFDRHFSPLSINGGDGWTDAAARKWLNDHEMTTENPSEDKGFLRFRQSDERAESVETTSSGMPDGIVLVKGKSPVESVDLIVVDGKGVKGKALAATLESSLPIGIFERNAKVREMAREAKMSIAQVNLLCQGKLNCASEAVLEVLARCLDVPTSRLVAAARQDGVYG